jgi:hypothetical protein
MIDKINDSPFTTILMGIAFIVIVLIGGIVTIVDSESLSFNEYITAVGIAAAGLGLLGIGRGINSGEKHRAYADSPPADTTEQPPQVSVEKAVVKPRDPTM